MFARLVITLLIYGFTPLFSCQIIYLNGTSSVGKTTIAKALQDEMNEPFLRIGIDQIIFMMPEKVNNWEGGEAELGFSWKKSIDEQGYPVQLLQVGPFAVKMNGAMREIVLALAKKGFNIIIDDVASEEGAYESWKATLKGYDVLWIGLIAPLDVIEKREKERGDRQVGQGRAAAGLVHKGFAYDLFLDTNASPLSETVQKIKQACKRKPDVTSP